MLSDAIKEAESIYTASSCEANCVDNMSSEKLEELLNASKLSSNDDAIEGMDTEAGAFFQCLGAFVEKENSIPFNLICFLILCLCTIL